MGEGKEPAAPAEWVARIRAARKSADIKAALEDCGRALQQFPDSGDLLFIYGEVRIDCFNQTKKPEHLKTALISFEKLLKGNPRHYMANLFAARIYYKGRAWVRADEKLAAILKVSPTDQRALELKNAIAKLKAPPKPAAEKPAEKPAEPVEQTDDTAEEQADFGDEVVTKEAIEGLSAGAETEYEGLINRFSIFAKLDGVRAIHLIDQSGVEIKSVLKGSQPLQNLSSHTASIYMAARLCSMKAGLGNFQRGTLITPRGSVMIVNVFYGLLALVLDGEADLKAVEARVNRYVEALAE